jgi:HD-GYP domain-containing protein (c-di-GMP phosphodiesterase class II)
MQTISPFAIAEGQRLDEDLFLPSGQKLLGGGAVVTPRILNIIKQLPYPELYQARSLQELVDAGVVKQLDRGKFRSGQTAQEDVLAAGGHLIVAKGDQLEDHHIDAINRGAFTSAAAAKHRSERMVLADGMVSQLEHDAAALNLRVAVQPKDIWATHTPARRPWPKIDGLVERRGKLVEQIRNWYCLFEAGLLVPLNEITAVVDELYSDLLEHRSRFTQCALLCPRRDNYLPDHVCCVCVLAMATSAQLGWSAADIKRMGLIALIFDVGMLLVPQRIRVGGCALTEIDRQRVQRHTAFSVALLESLSGLEPICKFAAYQHHERDSGVGYPAGKRGAQICDYAKVLAVTDVFAAATSPRSYHQATLPYAVMEEIIRSASVGIFDRLMVRAMVSATGLFPVGPCVLLSDRRNAHVVAVNHAQIDRPVVQILDPLGNPLDEMIDLSQLPPAKLAVTRAVPRPESVAA